MPIDQDEFEIVKTFNPIRVDKGEFRISINNLTALGDRVVDVLSHESSLGFPRPLQLFQGVSSAQIWAVIVQESGNYDHDSFDAFLKRREPRLDQLTLGDRDETLLIAGRFKQDDDSSKI